jgi:hypothetical protein
MALLHVTFSGVWHHGWLKNDHLWNKEGSRGWTLRRVFLIEEITNYNGRQDKTGIFVGNK